MRLRLSFLALSAWLFLFQGSASAILLIENGKKDPVGGFLVKEDAEKIVMRLKTPDGPVRVFDRTKVEILHKVDVARLEKLDKQTPKAYYDYAMKLAKEKADPEAMELALRLYVIAAYLDAPNLGKSSLLRMSDLATKPADARRYRAMAFVLDATSDVRLLKAEAVKTALPAKQEVKAPPKALARFQLALERYRTGKVLEAKADANDKGVAEYFGKAGLDQGTFLQACDDIVCTKCKKTGAITCSTCNGKGRVVDMMDPFGGYRICTTCNGKGKQKCTRCDGSGVNAVPEGYLKAVLRAEVWSLDQILPREPTSKKSSGGWDNALNDQQARAPLLALELITEYDPRQCVFRQGKWVMP